jgi:hypothetical protein
MIEGRDIPRCFPGASENHLLEWCCAGRIRPFQKCADPSGMDPKSPGGWRRYFPTPEARHKYNLLCDRYASLRSWLKSRRIPDEEVIKADRDRLALRLAKSGKPVELPEIEQFQYNLFRRRQRETAEISRLFSEIGQLENELSSPATWKDPRLTLSDLTALLLHSFFRPEDMEKVLSGASPRSAGKSEGREP